ncbi:MAG: extracellular solute-binding protein [Verrucomicrobiales bacterium]|jgi:ABC-type Fe3+ transport system substrate-binding protein|nr:extracellular solute-binding protein [Verrucomicrobiales bacterium]
MPARPLTVILLVALSLSAATASRAADDELIIVSPHWEGVRYEFGRAFEKFYHDRTGRTVSVRWRDLGGASQIEKALNASFAATPDSAQVDLLFGGGLDPYLNQKARGHLLAHQLPGDLRSQLPAEVGGIPLIDRDHMFYGAALASFGILQNNRVLALTMKPRTETWEDLCRPELRGWVSSADPRKSGAFHMIYEIILQAYGWERGWSVIYRMSGNVAAFLDNASGPAKEVALGNAVCAPTIDSYGLTQRNFLGRDNLSLVIPRDLSVINPDGIAILKGAPNLRVAEMFVDFVLSPRGQSLWMNPRGAAGGPVKFDIARMGVLPALYAADGVGGARLLNPFAQNYSIPYRPELGSRRWNLVNDLIGQTVIDMHPQLRRCWQAILSVPAADRGPFIEKFTAPFISEAAASASAALWRQDPAAARALAESWMKQAVQRYQTLEQEIHKTYRTY